MSRAKFLGMVLALTAVLACYSDTMAIGAILAGAVALAGSAVRK